MSAASLSTYEKFKHFLSDPNDAPPYGFQDNAITGIGTCLMHPARFALSIYEEGSAKTSLLEQLIHKACALFVAIVTSPATLVGALLKGIGSQFPQRVENLTSDQIQKTSASKIDQIYDLLQILDGVLRQNGIPYCSDGGTLLGMVRNGGIVPWDDDGDVILEDRYKARFQAHIGTLNQRGIVVQDGGEFESFKLTFDEQTLRNRYGVTSSEAANVDIFIVKEDSEGKIRPKSSFFKHQFPKEYFFRHELEQLRDYPFGPPHKRLFLKGPAQPHRYLTTFYGPECFEYAIQTHSHIQLGPFSFPVLNFSKTRYKIVNPSFAQGNLWR